MIASGLRWGAYLTIAAMVATTVFFLAFLAGSGFFSGLVNQPTAHLNIMGPARAAP
jgi:hypothetical protein